MKTLQEKIAELPFDTQQAIQKRFKKLVEKLSKEINYPNTTNLVKKIRLPRK